MTIYDSGLESFTYGSPGWVHVYNTNIEKLNNLLLKINALQDIDTDNLRDGAVLVWDSTATKWKCKTFN